MALAALSVSMTAKTPIIGVSGYVNGVKNMVNTTYINAVRYAGGVPLIVPVTGDDAQIEAIVNAIDGLVMTGGADFDPLKWFGEEPVRELGTIEPARDEFDVKLVRAAVAKGIPVLGICRGEQLLSIAFGGSLWQDIPSQVPESFIKHRQGDTAGSYGTHTISIEKGSFLEKALGATTASVNTFHHQAVKKLPQGFKVVATAPDGIIEAIQRDGKLSKEYADGGGLIMGTQFHPEALSTSRKSPFVGIFRILVEEASK